MHRSSVGRRPLPRRSAMRFAAPALAAWWPPRPAASQAEAPFPSRPVTILLGFAPGGGTDIAARLLAPRLQARFGQAVAVENRTGASGTIAATATARARPDGHTVTLGTVSGNVLAPLMLRPPPFDPVADLTPIALVATVPLVLTVPARSPANDVAGFVSMLRANPGRLNFASNGPGTSQHLAAELFMQATGREMVHVPYRGSGPATVDLIAGAVAVNFDTLSSVLPHIRQSAVRGLGVTTARRSEQAPELPTIADSGVPGFDKDVWYMLYGPPGLPQPVLAQWSTAVGQALTEPEIRRRLGEAGFDVGRGSPADAASLVRAEVARYGELIRRANIRLD